MIKRNITNYTLSKDAINEIDTKLRDLLEVCQIYHAPMFASVAIENSDEGTKYNNVTYSAQAHQISLKDDHIRKCILVADGFEAVPEREAVSFDMEEVFGDVE